tara:strand:+ start:1186 stop:1968 length:783 start_codon:yes stop_codon:yes gene_type:complete
MNNKEIAFLVGSVMNPSIGTFTTHEGHRSHQSREERARQTVLSLNSIFCNHPNAKVFLIDSSLDLTDQQVQEWCHPGGIYNFLQNHNIEIIKLCDIDRDVCIKINTHINKSYCEALIYDKFLEHYESKLADYDHIIKISGRYSLTHNCKDILINKNQVSFKSFIEFPNPNKFAWVNPVIKMDHQELWEMKWTPSFLFIFGGEMISELKNFFKFTIEVTENSSINIEDAIQYWLWKNKINNIPLDWKALAYTGRDSTLWYF